MGRIPPSIADIPLQVAPIGVVPDLVHPYSQGYVIIIIVIICLTLMVCSVALRIANGFVGARRFRWDDYVCITGSMSTVVLSGLTASLVRHGYGIHAWEVTIGKFGEDGPRNRAVIEMLYGPTISVIKLSILLLYLHIFAPSRRTRVLVYGGIIVVFVGNLTLYTLYAIFCIPRHEKSPLGLGTHQCFHQRVHLNLAAGIFNALTDYYILWIPLPIVWGMNLPLKKKIGVALVFLQGLLACGASLASVVYRFRTKNYDDVTRKDMGVVCTMVIELNIGIVCSCMPACVSLYRHYSPPTPIIRLLNSVRSQIPKPRGREGSESIEAITPRQDMVVKNKRGSSAQMKEADYLELEDVSVSESSGDRQRSA